jgi:hypothetical protein
MNRNTYLSIFFLCWNVGVTHKDDSCDRNKTFSRIIFIQFKFVETTVSLVNSYWSFFLQTYLIYNELNKIETVSHGMFKDMKISVIYKWIKIYTF